MKEPNPVANFDPSCALLVETNPDPEKGASTALTVAVCDGYAPTISWLVTKENGDQAIVVLMVRASRVGDPERKRPSPGAALALVVAALAVGALLADVLR